MSSVCVGGLAQRPCANGKVGQPVTFLGEVTTRERKKLSVVENVVAFLNARTDLVDQIVLGIGRSPNGIPFGKGERAQLIFLIGVRQRLVNDYLICLGTLAGVLKDDAVREALIGAQTAA